MTVKYTAPIVSVSAGSANASVSVGRGMVKEYVDRDPYEGSYDVTPTESVQTLATEDKRMTDDLVVEAIPSDYVGSAIPQKASADLTASGKTVTAPAGYYAADASKSVSDATWLAGKTIETDPTISVDGNGLVTASYLYSTSMKPLNATGWADKSHSVSITVKGSATHQLTVKDSSDLTVNDDTVSAPAGYYPESASKAVSAATWKNASTVSVVPEITVDSGGLITANASGWTSIYPLTASGYADANAAANIQLAGSRTKQLDTLGSTTYTPSTTAQTINPGVFLTGAQTIDPIPPQYYDMSGDLAWMGKDAQLVSSNWYSTVDKISNTLYNGWSPSTTAKAIVASVTLSDAKFTATDIDQWAYYIFWECGVDVAYTGSPTLKALPTFARALIVQCLGKRPSSFVNIQSSTCDSTFNQAAFTSSFLRYYGTTTGTLTYTWAASYGFYFSATAPTISSATATSPTITPKTPALNARTSTTYMSATSANAVDQANSKWWILGTKVYKARREVYTDGYYRYMCGVVNSTAPTT